MRKISWVLLLGPLMLLLMENPVGSLLKNILNKNPDSDYRGWERVIKRMGSPLEFLIPRCNGFTLHTFPYFSMSSFHR